VEWCEPATSVGVSDVGGTACVELGRGTEGAGGMVCGDEVKWETSPLQGALCTEENDLRVVRAMIHNPLQGSAM